MRNERLFDYWISLMTIELSISLGAYSCWLNFRQRLKGFIKGGCKISFSNLLDASFIWQHRILKMTNLKLCQVILLLSTSIVYVNVFE